MTLVEGQVLSLIISLPYHGEFQQKHPYLILHIDQINKIVEVGQLHSVEGKMFEAIDEKNKIIYATNPKETVIDKDSFIQKNNKITIELFEELEQYRRQPDKLTNRRFQEVVYAYDKYHKENFIEKNRKVHLSKTRILDLNS